MEFITVYILIVIFIATLVRSIFGFGEALIAVPLLALQIPIETAVPLSVLISIIIAAIVLVQDRKQVHFNSAKWLIIFSALGIPIGLLILIFGNEHYIKFGLGSLIILSSMYFLFSKSAFKLLTDNKTWLFICGFLAGIFGGAYGLNGPPIVFYGNMRRWTPKDFRATLQAYFLPVGILGMVGYWYNDLWDWTVTYYLFICIPVILPAIFIGRYLNHQIKDGAFVSYIYIGLICVGAALIAQAVY